LYYIFVNESIKNTGTCFIQKSYSPPLPYFKVNICPFPLPHFASIFFAYLWSFRWPYYIVTLPRYFSFRLPHLNITTGPPSDKLDKNIQRTSHFLLLSITYSHRYLNINVIKKEVNCWYKTVYIYHIYLNVIKNYFFTPRMHGT
jgi:hypothetical protein